TATVSNSSNQNVTWSLSGTGCSGASCGTLSSTTSNPVTYTAPTMVPSSTVLLTATSVADNTKSGNAVITVTSGGPPSVNVSLTPLRGGLTISETLAFTATVAGSMNTGVTWTASGGAFSSSTANPVTYTAPATAGIYTITATSAADGTASASATIGVTNLAGYYSWRGPESDTTRQGINLKEYALTTAPTSTVKSSTFGKLFSCPVDGFVFAEPLYVANLSIGGVKHNVVYVATENDSLYAFDADSPSCKAVWSTASVSLLVAGETAANSGDAGEVSLGPLIGITSTPVIDPTTNTLYAVAVSETAGSTFVQRLHAIDITTGKEKFSGPVVISASVAGSGSGSSGTPAMISFDPLRNHQRPGLLLSNGAVYIAWASHDDNPIYHGWVIAYNASTLKLTAAFSPTPDGSASGGLEGGIWMTGAAPAADSSGNIYVSVGNGTFDDITDTIPPVAPNDDFGDSILKLKLAGSSLSVSDFFTPDDQMALDTGDIDLGSTGVVLLPDLTGASPTHLMFCGGKDGHIYLINRDMLGEFVNSHNNVVQFFQLSGDTSNGFRSTPAFFNNFLYGAGFGDPLMAVTFSPSTRQFSATPAFQSAESYGGFGTTPMVSAQGTSNGIVWTIGYGPDQGSPSSPAILRAYDATNLTTLYDSSQQGSRDTAGLAVKFTVPTVANGKVYVGTQTELDVYGLLPN
ncbi:MAG TPA: hypothetical protein VIX19_07280, partial [Terriglobales bacterium]